MSKAAESRSRRGDPEVVEKRRAARHFNDVLLSKGGAAGHDGRTERRRKRLYSELERSAAGEGRALKPLDVLKRIEELLELGEPLARIRKAYPPRPLVDPRPELVDGLRRLHRAYGFRVDVYRFVGLGDDALAAAGIAGGKAPVGKVDAKAEAKPRGKKPPPVPPRPPARARPRARARGRQEDAA